MELFRLFGRIGIKNAEANDAIDETTDKAKDAEDKMSGNFEKIGTKALKMASVVGTAAATAVTALTTMAVKNYADFEQLAGGAELMFGEAFQNVMNNAKNAYSTVQMSQNEYLQQVNGFATGLKTALGGNEQAAADLAHKIIKAEADVVAATGNTAENVQNAFNGIMKSNFTMLDNLQIGITPTKEGFQEVIDKVNEWNTANGKATSYQMGNLADMQSALVDYIDMVGMSGYASAEAAGTIQGSLASTKAALNNLLVGIAAGDQDLQVLYENLYDSGMKLAENLIPRIKTAFTGLFKLVTDKLPWLDEFAAVIATITGAVAAYVAVQKLKTALDIKEAATIGAVTKALWLKVTAMGAALAPYLAVAAVIAVVIAAGVKLYKNWDKVKEKAGQLKSYLSGCFRQMKQDTIDQFNAMKDGIVSKFNAAKERISGVISRIKGLLDFSWSFPKPKLPGFRVSGGEAPWGIGGKGSMPSLGIEWYAKAMNDPMVMTSPTIFGYNPITGNAMGGGEAGSEVVSGTNTLMGMISDAVSQNNGALIDVLYKILSAILSMDGNMGENLKNALDGTSLEVNRRVFGRLVKEVG